jgi:hypothetical protein
LNSQLKSRPWAPWVVDNKLDDLAEAIEALMEMDFEVPGLPSAEFRLTSTDIDSTDAFEQPLGGALMLYEVTYWRPYRVDTSDENKICEVFANGPDGIVAQVGECEGVCEPGPGALMFQFERTRHGVAGFAASDADRRHAGAIEFGKVHEADYPKRRLKVLIGDEDDEDGHCHHGLAPHARAPGSK